MKPMGLCLLLGFLLFFYPALAAGKAPEEQQLYAQAAVLLDGDSGRVLYSKNGEEKLPMASTTKIMTLLVTLENADLEGTVTVSSYAASMPDVQLNIREGERYRLKDLCYSMMLESHNDAAAAIAEHVGGSVEGFASMMNQKARDLGCYHTYFITPNGLDAEDEYGVHSTTAEDLARIMRFCIQNDAFLSITREPSWSFTDLDGTRSFTVNNKNAFLNMMAGALTGKTGFTTAAGYCSVGALEREGKRLIVALLACGWPNNRTWKWSDTQTLMNYGLENYHQETIGDEIIRMEPAAVQDGQQPSVELRADICTEQMLLKEGDVFRIETDRPAELQAPVEEGQIVGTVTYYLNDGIVDLFPVYTAQTVQKIDFWWCLDQIIQKWI